MKRVCKMKCLVNLENDSHFIFDKEVHGKYASQSAPILKAWNTSKLGFHLEILEVAEGDLIVFKTGSAH